MPNHVHLLFHLDAPLQTEDYIARFGPQPKGSVGLLIGAFKGAVKRDISRARREETVVWQPRFHERVIRNDDELARIRRTIENNPANWTNDRCHPAHPHFEAVWQGFDPDSDWNIA